MKQRVFLTKSEPIFLAALKNKSEQLKEIVALVLPQLLRANRLDSFAVKFYLEVPRSDISEGSQCLEMIARSYCKNTWKYVDSTLHQRCEEVFQSLDYKFRSDMLRKVAESNLSSKIHQLKLLNASDLRLLKKLKIQMGLSMSFFEQFGRTYKKLLSFFRILASKFLMIRTWFFVLVIISITSLIYREWQTQQSVFVGEEGQVVDTKNKRLNAFKKGGIHTLQVAAFTSSRQASDLINSLKQKGVRDVYQVTTKRKSGETWYKIRVGRFDSKEKAQMFAGQLFEQKTIKNYFVISLPIN